MNTVHYFYDGIPCECDKIERVKSPEGFIETAFPCLKRRSYFADGQLKRDTPAALKDGVALEFHRTGFLGWSDPLIKGQKHGICKRYEFSGKLLRENLYVNGEMKIMREYKTTSPNDNVFPMENFI
jgi:hypothetical protein